MTMRAEYSEGRKTYRHADRKLPSVSMLVGFLTGERFEDVPLDTLRKAAREGTGAHSVACELALCRMLIVQNQAAIYPPTPGDYPGGGEEWQTIMDIVRNDVRAFLDQYAVEPLAIEQPSVCTAYGFAGQPDMKAEIMWKGNRIRAVIDYKRVAGLAPGHQLQVQAYRLLDGYRDTAKGFILWLKKGGGFELIEVRSDPHAKAAIIAAATVLGWKMQNGLLDVKNVW